MRRGSHGLNALICALPSSWCKQSRGCDRSTKAACLSSQDVLFEQPPALHRRVRSASCDVPGCRSRVQESSDAEERSREVLGVGTGSGRWMCMQEAHNLLAVRTSLFRRGRHDSRPFEGIAGATCPASARPCRRQRCTDGEVRKQQNRRPVGAARGADPLIIRVSSNRHRLAGAAGGRAGGGTGT